MNLCKELSVLTFDRPLLWFTKDLQRTAWNIRSVSPCITKRTCSYWKTERICMKWVDIDCFLVMKTVACQSCFQTNCIQSSDCENVNWWKEILQIKVVVDMEFLSSNEKSKVRDVGVYTCTCCIAYNEWVCSLYFFFLIPEQYDFTLLIFPHISCKLNFGILSCIHTQLTSLMTLFPIFLPLLYFDVCIHANYLRLSQSHLDVDQISWSPIQVT